MVHELTVAFSSSIVCKDFSEHQEERMLPAERVRTVALIINNDRMLYNHAESREKVRLLNK